ncbi:MAG: YggL family protein [Deltaproteobacteria bacterium]|nr:YggL family protein [Deltaproteobacteria bacterium]
MKKRLRKKKHLEEFAQWGRQIVIVLDEKEKLNGFLDAFIDEAIEANGCYCGGGGSPEKLSFVIELGRRSDNPDGRFKKIGDWLDARADIQRWKASEKIDLCHGDYEDIAENR